MHTPAPLRRLVVPAGLVTGFLVLLCLLYAVGPTSAARATSAASPTTSAAPTDARGSAATPAPRPPTPYRVTELLLSVRRAAEPPETSPRPRARSGKRARERAGKGPKVAYLTFDDGPSDHTPRVLRILTKHDATATFFVLGDNAARHRGALRAIRRQGSAVGNHTNGHPMLARLGDRAVRNQLRIGVRTSCFRPPYGSTNRRVVRLARAAGQRQVLWTADSRDWEKPGPAAIQRKALLDLHPGSIILMHDGGGDRTQTVRALPDLLRTLDRRGYEVRALPYC